MTAALRPPNEGFQRPKLTMRINPKRTYSKAQPKSSGMARPCMSRVFRMRFPISSAHGERLVMARASSTFRRKPLDTGQHQWKPSASRCCPVPVQLRPQALANA